MSRRYGLLRYKVSGDRVCSIEASRVVGIDPFPPGPKVNENRSVIGVDVSLGNSAVVVYSTEDAAALMDRYDSIVKDKP